MEYKKRYHEISGLLTKTDMDLIMYKNSMRLDASIWSPSLITHATMQPLQCFCLLPYPHVFS